jgi:hypothetical protein
MSDILEKQPNQLKKEKKLGNKEPKQTFDAESDFLQTTIF